jgi:hypothetical protein
MRKQHWVICQHVAKNGRRCGKRIFRYNEQDGRIELAAGAIVNPRYTQVAEDEFEPSGEIGTAHCPRGHVWQADNSKLVIRPLQQEHIDRARRALGLDND